MLDANTFSNKGVIEHANKNLISLKIDVDTKEGSELFSSFSGTALPTLIFTDSSGNEIDRIIGYLSPKEYKDRIFKIENNLNTLSSSLEKYNRGERNPELIFTIASKYTDRNETKIAKEYYIQLLNLYPNLDKEMAESARFQLAYEDFKNGDVSSFNEFIDKFSTSDMAKNALSLMARYYKGENNQENELKVYMRMLELYPKDPSILNGYAWRMTELELNLEDALIKANDALKLVNDDKDFKVGILDTIAEILWKMGRLNEAILTIDEALKIDSQNNYLIDQKLKFVNSKDTLGK